MAATKSLAPSKTPSSSRPSAATISLTSSNNASASALSQARSTSLGAKICSRSNSSSPISPSTKAQIRMALRLRYHPHRAQTMTRNPADLLLNEHLDYLKLTCVKENCQPLAVQSAANHWSHLDYLGRLLQGEVAARQQRTIARRVKAARFPVIKTLEGFRWDWPKKINRLQIQDLFRLRFIEEKANVIFLGLVGLGKTHLATARAYAACQNGYSVLFANAIDVLNTLSAAQTNGILKSELKRYLAPALLVLDEVGYLPIDQRGADLLFQVISQRYERGSIVITSNKAFKQWPSIFNGDSTITSAVLDRLLHHAETTIIEGSSYRMKDRIET